MCPPLPSATKYSAEVSAGFNAAAIDARDGLAIGPLGRPDCANADAAVAPKVAASPTLIRSRRDIIESFIGLRVSMDRLLFIGTYRPVNGSVRRY